VVVVGFVAADIAGISGSGSIVRAATAGAEGDEPEQGTVSSARSIVKNKLKKKTATSWEIF
jgi:hypothetical protein